MSYIYRGFLVLVAALTLSFGPSLLSDTQASRRSAVTRGSAPELVVPVTPTTADFTVNQMEFYLGDDQIAYIRPGLQIRVNSITIGADRKPVIDITVTDDFGNPLDRAGLTTPGAISISFILARYDAETGDYTSYTTRTQTVPAGFPNAGASAVQASADSGGTWTALEQGHYTYKFRTVLPENFPTDQTHTLGIYAARNLDDIIGKRYYENVEHDFRPDGQPVTVAWDRINQEASCLNCHDELAFHGGSRRDVKLCVLCHNPQTVDPDTGESQEMAVLIHRIHRGANLPSVLAGEPYIIVGNQQSVHDYSHVVYPQDIRNCENCHLGTNPNAVPEQAHVFLTLPSRSACGSCHDNIDWMTGEGHVAGPQSTDSACSSCHQPDGPEFGPSIAGAHTIPTESSQLEGLNVEVVSVTNTAPGEKPTVAFRVTNDDGTAINATTLATFSPMLAGPTTSYRNYYRENARTAGQFDSATGLTTYTFTNAIPEDTEGSWVISGDFYRMVNIQRADGEPDISVREAAFNPIHYFAVTDESAMPRRTVVALANCNECHDTLALHGGQRFAIEECVICHNPHETDAARRPAAAGAPESVSFQYMIHRIHAGEELQNEFTVYGFGGSRHNYNHVVYPGNLANCDKCHVGGSEQLPPPVTADPVFAPRWFFSPLGAGTAACLGCHDSRDASAHAFLNTATFPGSDQPAEACATCHGVNAEWSVDESHAQ